MTIALLIGQKIYTNAPAGQSIIGPCSNEDGFVLSRRCSEGENRWNHHQAPHLHRPKVGLSPLAALHTIGPMKMTAILRLLAACMLATSLACRAHPSSISATAPNASTTTRATALATTAPTAVPQLAVGQLQKDLYYLASDELEGRGVGTRGLDTAADFLAARFKSLGLRPVSGCPDYFQPFPMNTATSIDPATTLASGDTKYELSKQYSPTGFSAEGDFAGPVVFAGYGISNTKRNYDDYASVDVKGKVVLMLRFEPHNEKGTSRFMEGDWSPDASLSSKAENAAAHGAVALLLVNPPKFHGSDHLMPISRGGAKSAIPFVQIKQQVADELLKRGGSAKDLQTLQTEIDTDAKPQSFDLKGINISGKVAIERRKAPVKNVLAYLPGGSHPDEYVIVGAHYDHLGHGGAASLARGSDEIHSGADDNASGTVAVLDLAEQLVYAGRRDRSILFILFTG